MKRLVVQNEPETSIVTREVIESLSGGEGANVLALKGDLGAGKTTFVQLLAQELGVRERITSPTFVIMKSYAIPKHPHFSTLVHIDAYRVEDNNEMRVLGFDEVVSNPANLVCIEWPEKIADLIPENTRRIEITIDPKRGRLITYDE